MLTCNTGAVFSVDSSGRGEGGLKGTEDRVLGQQDQQCGGKKPGAYALHPASGSTWLGAMTEA